MGKKFRIFSEILKIQNYTCMTVGTRRENLGFFSRKAFVNFDNIEQVVRIYWFHSTDTEGNFLIYC